MRKAVHLLLLLCLLAACGERSRNMTALNRATQLMDSHPDSALLILDSLMGDTSRLTTHFLMQCRLHRLNALNKLDTVFTSTTVQQSLVRHFDDGGTPNEQMLAYYLLGRAHDDIGEAPAALSNFMEAAERADTAAPDCNFALLSRVYGQMGSIFYHQNLMQDNLDCLDKSIDYAWKAKDTLQALNSIAYKMGPFQRLQMHDSLILTSNYIYNMYKAKGFKNIGASYYILAIGSYLNRGEFEEAKHCIDVYEGESGYFDADGNIEKGREAYYKSKGSYYLAIHQYDSAEYYFRKELREGRDFNNQNMASKRLSMLFQQTHKPDSAAKYALYSYDMNDSAYAQMATDKVEQMKSLYNYTRHQEIAKKESERAGREERKALSRLYIIIGIIILACYISYRVWEKRKIEKQKYQEQLVALEQVQSEIVKLRTHEAEFKALIQEKEKEENLRESERAKIDELRQQAVALNQLIREKEAIVERQQKEIAHYQQKEVFAQGNVESLISKSEIHLLLESKSNKGQTLTDEEWHDIHRFVIKVLPGFYQFISSKQYALNTNEYRTCILTRLHVKPSCISSLLGVSPSYISKIRPKLIEILFEVNGSGKDFESKLLEIS